MNIISAQISIIIPIYNTEKYLKKCLDSIVNQTLGGIEIICINDGSTDNSLSILEEYAEKDARITVLSLQNGGQGRARNIGMDIAKAPYVLFVDSDDCIHPESCRFLYEAMTDQNCDIVISDMLVHSNQKELQEQKISYQKYYDSTSRRRGLYDNTVNITQWRTSPVSKLYKKEIIDKHNLRFPEKLIQEDEAWHWFYFTNIKTIYYLDAALYYRTLRHGSTMQMRDKNLEGVSDFAYILQEIYFYLKKNDIYAKYLPEFQKYFQEKSSIILKRCGKKHYGKAYKPLFRISKKLDLPLPPPPKSENTYSVSALFMSFMDFILAPFIFPWYIYITYKNISKRSKNDCGA